MIYGNDVDNIDLGTYDASGVMEPLNSSELKPKNYNRFQVSKMFGDGYQIVIRTDSMKELLKAMEEAKHLVGQLENRKQIQPSGNQVAEKPQSFGSCEKCGAERVKNPKTGKIFCKDKCWLNEPRSY